MLETAVVGSFYPLLKTTIGEGQAVNAGVILKFLERIVNLIPVDEKIIASAIVLFVLGITSSILGFLSDFMSKFFQYKISESYINQTYRSLLNKPASYIFNKKQGELTYLGMNASVAVGELFHYLPKTVVELFRVLTVIAFLFSMSIKVTLGVLFLVFLAGLAYIYLSSSLIYPLAQQVQKETESQTSLLIESVQGAVEIQTFKATRFFIDRYSEIVRRLTRTETLKAAYLAIPKHVGMASVISVVCFVLVFLKAKYPEIYKSSMPIFAIYLLSIQKMINSVMNVGNNWAGLKNLSPRLEALQEGLKETKILKVDIKNEDYEGEIVFKDVSFQYGDGYNVLKNFNLKINENEFVALVGPSGAGKSTVMNLLSGAYFCNNGELVFGKTVSSLESISQIRNEMAVVNQTPFLFNASILENIRVSKPDATFEEIKKASRDAFADEFINALPEKYETVIGDKGTKLSGGQRQRIAIARALLKEPKVLLLDEATSALDNVSEAKIKAAINHLKGKLTVVIVAHRLSTIEHADVIVVMRKGKIVQKGSHHELLEEEKGEYFKLYHNSGY